MAKRWDMVGLMDIDEELISLGKRGVQPTIMGYHWPTCHDHLLNGLLSRCGLGLAVVAVLVLFKVIMWRLGRGITLGGPSWGRL
jgi:hypothetical protein